MPIPIGINGLGRIGRSLLRLAWESPDVSIVAVNDVAAPKVLAHLLKHDSVSGEWERAVEGGLEALRIDGRQILCSSRPSPVEIPWSKAGAAIVIEATGRFQAKEAAQGHRRAGADRVIISSPSPDADLTVAVGVNDSAFDPERHWILSNGSCTTQCVAPLVDLLDREFGVEAVSMTTVHCYTNDQPLMDAPHRDLRRARAAGLSMIPTTTSAAGALEKVFPRLAGKIACLAVRVPVAFVSAVDLVVSVTRPTDLDSARRLFRDAAGGAAAGIVGYTEQELVSVDYRGDARSAVVDGLLTTLPHPRLIKVFAWYDNESGYTHRLLDLIRNVANRTGGVR